MGERPNRGRGHCVCGLFCCVPIEWQEWARNGATARCMKGLEDLIGRIIRALGGH